MEDKDIRWQQRFANFSKAFLQLEKFIQQFDTLNELEEQGMIQAFEYNFELAWNVIKDYYTYQGESDIQGSRDAFRLGFKRGLLRDGESWMNMIESRMKTSHTYNEQTAKEVISAILNEYFALFKELHITMDEILKKERQL
ncbi:MAG: nucleotidyltransferase substrate binding protein [Saprospiraceae bacterium]|nr:nucleotidyltransferase substrate binding protein [Saprospiraceae bacterium]